MSVFQNCDVELINSKAIWAQKINAYTQPAQDDGVGNFAAEQMKLLAAQQEQQRNTLAQQSAQQNATFSALATQMQDALIKHKQATGSPLPRQKSAATMQFYSPLKKVPSSYLFDIIRF